MATDISSLLLQVLGSDNKASAEWTKDLPDSLKKLTDAIGKAAASTVKANAENKGKSDSEKRAGELNDILRQFSADLRETARAYKELNATEDRSLKLAERNAKEGAARRKRAEAASDRAEKINEIAKRQEGERDSNMLNLIGAIGGKGLQGIVSNFVNASRQTEKDIAQLSEARYKDLVDSAAERRESRIESSDRDVAMADDALAEAAKTYAEAQVKITSDMGAAVQNMIEGGSALDAVDRAKEAYDKADAERKRIAAEGNAALAKVQSGGAVKSSEKISGDPRSGTLADIASAIREGTQKNADLILDSATKDAILRDEMEKVAAEVAAANLAADKAASEASDAYAAARRESDKTGYKFVAGSQGALAASEERRSATAEYASAAEAVRQKKASATEEKAAAITSEESAVQAAFTRKEEGKLASAGEKQAIGTKNLMSTAIMPPAIAVIAKSVEKFSELFPVFEQTGNAIVEMSSALPAALTTLGFKAVSNILRVATTIKEVFSKSDVSKRYEKSDAIVLAQTKRTRGELYAQAYEGQVEKYKGEMVAADDTKGRFTESRIRALPKANAPKSFTVATTPSAASGITHSAGSRAEATAPVPSPVLPSIPEREQTLGVVPVSASNRNIDEWR